MNVYKRFIAKQQEICEIINKQEQAESELTAIKREIYKKHMDRFKKKPVGKTTLKDDGFEITYNRSEKISLLMSIIEKDKFESDCIKKKIVPQKETFSFSKTEYKKLSDEKQKELDKYIVKEFGTPTISVKIDE